MTGLDPFVILNNGRCVERGWSFDGPALKSARCVSHPLKSKQVFNSSGVKAAHVLNVLAHIVSCCCISECEHGGGEADVFCSGAVYFTEGDKPVECGRQVPAEPRFHPDSAQLLFGLLLLCASLHRGISTTEI